MVAEVADLQAGTLKLALIIAVSSGTSVSSAPALNYIEVFYNRRCRHSALDYRTPTDLLLAHGDGSVFPFPLSRANEQFSREGSRIVHVLATLIYIIMGAAYQRRLPQQSAVRVYEFLTPQPALLITRRNQAVPASRCKRNKQLHMTDLIYIAILVLFFAASGLYAHACEKL